MKVSGAARRFQSAQSGTPKTVAKTTTLSQVAQRGRGRRSELEVDEVIGGVSSKDDDEVNGDGPEHATTGSTSSDAGTAGSTTIRRAT